jgi:invasion protein IalB
MLRAPQIALLAASGCFLVSVAAAAAFFAGHGVGMREKIAIDKALRAREQNSLTASNMTRRSFQNWSLICRDWAENERRCVLFVAVASPDMNQLLLTVSIARTSKGVPVLIVDTPPGVAVGRGVTVTAGEASPLRVPIQACGPQRCRAVAELTPQLRGTLEAAESATITYVRDTNQESTYNLSTLGFRDGISAWLAESGTHAISSAAAVN